MIVESTSPVGTTERVAQIIADLRPDLVVPCDGATEEADIALAYCPERVLPGRIVNELVHNDRVIGGVATRLADAPLAPPGAACEIDVVVRPGTGGFRRPTECRLALVATDPSLPHSAPDAEVVRRADRIEQVAPADLAALSRILDEAG